MAKSYDSSDQPKLDRAVSKIVREWANAVPVSVDLTDCVHILSKEIVALHKKIKVLEKKLN